MRNRPSNILQEAEPPPRLRDEYALDRSPGLRLLCLFAVLLVPLAVVTGRLVSLQFTQADLVIAGIEPRLRESLQPIETTDGRILLGSTVLARDVPAYRLKLHYRWLEEPADARWLKRKVTGKLSASERSDRVRVAALTEQFLAERERLWNRLSLATGLTDDEFRESRQRVQERVEGIVSRVERAREERLKAAQREQDQIEAAQEQQRDWLDSTWHRIRHELTTSPHQRRVEPVEITEELDYHVIAEDLPLDRIADIISRPELYPGVEFEMVTRREYPAGKLVAHYIGVREAVPDDQREQRSLHAELDGTASPRSRVIHPGLEQSYDRYLRGTRGLERIVRDPEGEIIRREVIRQPEPGADLKLALIEPLQRRMEELLDRRLGLTTDGSEPVDPESGHEAEDVPEGNLLPDGSRPRGACVIAMHVETGELLAAAVSPRFELQSLANHDAAWWQQIQTDPRTPLVNRLTSMALPPGSVFKTLTAVAAVESGLIDPGQTVYCRGHLYESRPDRYRCWTFRHNGYGHGDVALRDALCQSCNVYFYTVAGRMGPGPIIQTAQHLGFGRPTGIDLPGETGGQLPQAAAPRAIELTSFQEPSEPASSPRVPLVGDPLNLAIGQSNLTVTPLQIVRLMASVANGGRLVTPRLADSLQRPGDPAATRLRDVNPGATEAMISERTRHFVREGLEMVVTQGTGKRVALKEIAIAGKTGTAEVAGRIDHAWFAGFAPADQPRVAFVVVLEHGGAGGRDAGPIAKELIQTMLDLDLLPARQPRSRDTLRGSE